MTERKTGATAAQIEAAQTKNAELNGYTRGDSNILDFAYFSRGNRLWEDAALLVDEHHRIVSVADLRALLSAVPSEGNWVGEIVPDDLRDRITALIGDGA